jgi:hypothetical protein
MRTFVAVLTAALDQDGAVGRFFMLGATYRF